MQKNICYEELIKYIWILILLPKVLQLLVLIVIILICLWKNEWKITVDYFTKSVLVYFAINMLSICINSISYNGIDRIIAAINTSIIWPIALMYYWIFKNSKINMRPMSKYCFYNCLIMFCLLVINRILYEVKNIDTFLVFDRYLYFSEGNGRFIRFVGLMEYPTLVVSFLLLMLPGGIYYIELILNGVKNVIYRCMVYAIFCIMILAPIYYGYSRMGYILVIFSFCGIFFLHIDSIIPPKRYVPYMILGFLAALLMVFTNIEKVQLIISRLMGIRVGSNITRSLIYKETIRAFLNNIFIGCGIKDMWAPTLPLGSHSTYLGFLYKTGILGTLSIMLGFIYQMIKAIKTFRRKDSRHRMVSLIVLVMFIYAILEDLDGADWLLCSFFALLGVMANNEEVSLGSK